MDHWLRNITTTTQPQPQSNQSTNNSTTTTQSQSQSLFSHSEDSFHWSHPQFSSSLPSITSSAHESPSDHHHHLTSDIDPSIQSNSTSLWPTTDSSPSWSWQQNLPSYQTPSHLQAFSSSYTRHILSTVQGDFDRFLQRMYHHPRASISNPTNNTSTSQQDHHSQYDSIPFPGFGIDPPVPVRTQRISLTLPSVRSILSASESLPSFSQTAHPSSPSRHHTNVSSILPESLAQSYASHLTGSDLSSLERPYLYGTEEDDGHHTDLHPSLTSYDQPRLLLVPSSLYRELPSEIQSVLHESLPRLNHASASAAVTPDSLSQIDHLPDPLTLPSQLSSELHITLNDSMDHPGSRVSVGLNPSFTSDFDQHTTRARATARFAIARPEFVRRVPSQQTSHESEEDISTSQQGSPRRRKRSCTAPMVSQDLPSVDPSSYPASTSNTAPTTADLAEEAARNTNPHRALPAFYSQDPQILTPEMTISIDTDPMTRRQIILDHSTHGPIRWHNASQKAIYEASKDGLVGEEIGMIRFSYLSIPPRERQRDRDRTTTESSSQEVEDPEESSTSRAATENHQLRSFYLTSGEWGPPTSTTSFRESLGLRPTLFSWGRRAMAHDLHPSPPSSSLLDPMSSNFLEQRLAYHSNRGPYRSSTFGRLPSMHGSSASSSSRRMRREEEYVLPPLLPRQPPSSSS